MYEKKNSVDSADVTANAGFSSFPLHLREEHELSKSFVARCPMPMVVR